MPGGMPQGQTDYSSKTVGLAVDAPPSLHGGTGDASSAQFHILLGWLIPKGNLHNRGHNWKASWQINAPAFHSLGGNSECIPPKRVPKGLNYCGNTLNIPFLTGFLPRLYHSSWSFTSIFWDYLPGKRDTGLVLSQQLLLGEPRLIFLVVTMALDSTPLGKDSETGSLISSRNERTTR